MQLSLSFASSSSPALPWECAVLETLAEITFLSIKWKSAWCAAAARRMELLGGDEFNQGAATLALGTRAAPPTGARRRGTERVDSQQPCRSGQPIVAKNSGDCMPANSALG